MHKEENPHNSQVPRTNRSICLGLSVNIQGRYKFMNLNTTNKIVRWSRDLIFMTDTAIDRVNKLGNEKNRQLALTDRHGHIIGYIEIP